MKRSTHLAAIAALATFDTVRGSMTSMTAHHDGTSAALSGNGTATNAFGGASVQTSQQFTTQQ